PLKERRWDDTARAATSNEVKDLRREARALKEVVAELMLENRLLKKSTIGAGEDGASDTSPPKSSRLSAWSSSPRCRCAIPWQNSVSPRGLLPLGRPAQSWRAGGLERSIAPARSSLEPHSRWRTRKRYPDGADEPALSPRELAVRFTDSQSLFRLRGLGLP